MRIGDQWSPFFSRTDNRDMHVARVCSCQPGQLRVGDQTKGFPRIEEAAAPERFVG